MPITLTVDIADFGSQVLDVTVEPFTSPAATVAGEPTLWDVRAVTLDNTGIYAFYPGAQVRNITWNYNAPDTAEVAISLDDLGLSQLDPDHSDSRELQIWRNGYLLFTGKPWSRRAENDSRLMVFSCKDPTAYLQHRYIGRANRVNRLANSSFETTVAPWQQYDPGSDLSVGISTNHAVLGTHSLAIVTTDISQGPFVFQQIVATAGVKDLRLFLTGWYYVSAGFAGPSLFDAGMMLYRNVAGTGAGKYSYAKIKEDTETNQWVRLETFVRIPAGRTELVQARLFPVDGTIYWDAITLVADEHLSWNFQPDQGVVVSDIVNYLQGKGKFAALSPEKSDCFVRPVMPTTGVEVQEGRVYYFADHQKGFDGSSGSRAALDHYLNASDGIDWRFEPPGRILRGHFPIGEDRTDVTFTFRKFPLHPERDGSYGIVGWRFADSEEGAATQVVELGGWGGTKYPGDPTREEGSYRNDAALGGLSLELVETAPQGMPISQLDARATSRGRRLSRPVATPQLILAEPRDDVTGEVSYPLIGVLLPGDTIAVDVVDGTFAMSGDWRVAQVSLDGATDELTVTPNPVLV